jgi:GNAT superfamily N-acetyltransferase
MQASTAAAARVRPVARADFEQWLPLWASYNAFYGRSGPTALPLAITETTWARFFDATEPVRALVAESDARLVGLAHYLFHRSTTCIEPVCYLQDLFTVATLRGKGIGRRLIEEVAGQARTAGATRLYWLTHESNATARGLYEKLAQFSGFIVYRKPL